MLEIFDHGEVREIRLNRPPANALNPELVDRFNEALAAAADEASALVISGRPGMFSAGLDVPELLQLDREGMTDFWFRFSQSLKAIATLPIPSVFAMTGHAPAGGIVLAIFGDYRIMPEGNFKTGMNEVQVGLLVPSVVHQALVGVIGRHRAERILVAGEMMVAQRALDIGLVDELADSPEAVVERAIEWCQQHVALPRATMQAMREMTRAPLHDIFATNMTDSVERFIGTWFSEPTQKILHDLVARLGK